MKWFEYIFVLFAILIVLLPIFLFIKNSKEGISCTNNCKNCSSNCPFKKNK